MFTACRTLLLLFSFYDQLQDYWDPKRVRLWGSATIYAIAYMLRYLCSASNYSMKSQTMQIRTVRTALAFTQGLCGYCAKEAVRGRMSNWRIRLTVVV